MNITFDDLIVEPDQLTEVAEQELRDAARLEGATAEMIELLYSPTATIHDDPAAVPNDPYADYFAWAQQQERRRLPSTELTDLMHVIERNRPDQRRQALAEWQAHLNDGWETVDISNLVDADGKITRIVVLRRECPPLPITPDPQTTSAINDAIKAYYAEESARPVTMTIHPTITVIPQERPANPVLAKLLADHPIAAHLHEHGVEGTLEAMNSRVREAGRAAYEQRKSLWDEQRRQFSTVPLLL